MFYSMRIILLAGLALFSGMQAQDTVKEQMSSFFKGVGPAAFFAAAGWYLGYITNRPYNQRYIASAIGTLGGAAIDHFYLGGKTDKHQVARKLGIAFSVIILGNSFYNNNKSIMLSSRTLNKNGYPEAFLVYQNGGDTIAIYNCAEVRAASEFSKITKTFI